MLVALTVLLLTAVVDAADKSINNNMTSESCIILTTSAGAPVEERDTDTLNTNLINNDFFMDGIAHLNHERTPERVVHGNGAGAFGYFEVTHDFTDICEADLFSAVGKKTPIAVRFSTTVVERDGPDTSRDTRGFAIKFYTEDGNFDLVGQNFPVFVIKDPIYFTTFTHSQRRHPATHLRDPNMMWDFFTLRPESLLSLLLMFGDRGIPDGYRHMPGYGVHTFQVVNAHGVSSFVKFILQPDAGNKNMSSEKALHLAGTDPDYAIRDLYYAIESGNFPSWTVSVQAFTLDDVKNASFDVFDVTKTIPYGQFPLRPIGRIVLNRNPCNYFAEIEQLAFCPGNLVPGIVGCPDKLFEGRRLAYRDALKHRLGINFNKIPVNCPIHAARTYNRDGVQPLKDNEKDALNYFPNSYKSPQPYVNSNRVELLKIIEEEAEAFEQASELYMNIMTKEERSRMVENILDSLVGVTKSMEEKVVKVLTKIHPDLGNRIKKGLQENMICTK